MPRDLDKMEDKRKTHSFTVTDMKSAVHTILELICCKKKRIKERVETSNVTNVEANLTLKQHDIEEPWLKRYYKTAIYHPGQFISDTEDGDNQNDDYMEKEEVRRSQTLVETDKITVKNVEKIVKIKTFSFPFENSTFQFPHMDYDKNVENIEIYHSIEEKMLDNI